MEIKQIEISSTFGGVIAEAPFENVKPLFTDRITIDLSPGDDEEAIRGQYRTALLKDQQRAFDLLRNQLKADLVEQQFQKIRFREKDGKKYPSVTSITDWSKDWHISDTDLQQYGARGTIIHYLIPEFFKHETWLTIEEVAESGLSEEVIIMTRGSLGLKIEDCSHEEFFAQYGKDFEIDEFEFEIFNEKHLYSGRADARGRYLGVPSIIDFKTGSSWDMRQLAAYANGDGIEGIEQLVICPVGPNSNKSGIKKPVVTQNIKGAFDNFLKDRSEFQKRFGI